MRQIRETLRLHLQAGLSYSEVARALKISKSAAGKYVSLARVADVDWEVAQTLSDDDLEARLYRPALPRASLQRAPDFGVVHQELKHPGVTLMLLWGGGSSITLRSGSRTKIPCAPARSARARHSARYQRPRADPLRPGCPGTAARSA